MMCGVEVVWVVTVLLTGQVCVIQDMFRFFGVALILQLCIFLIVAVPAVLGRQQAVQEAFKTLVATVIAAVPIAAPTVILTANGACMQRLRKHRIDVLNPAKLKTIANVSVVCFDKTGTLTGSVVSAFVLFCHKQV